MKYILIAYFLGNVCANNCLNRNVCQDYSKSAVRRFFKKQCTLVKIHLTIFASSNCVIWCNCNCCYGII